MRDALRSYDRFVAGLSRRELLNITWKLGLAAVLQPVASRTLLAQPLFTAYPFTLGVASGDPLARRCRPVDAAGARPTRRRRHADGPRRSGLGDCARSRVHARSRARGRWSRGPSSGTACTSKPADSSRAASTSIASAAAAKSSQVGRTKTAPAQGAPADGIRFAVCGCNHYETGYFTAFRHLANEQFDFVFHTGDYIYEGRGDAGRNPALVRQHRGQEIYTLVDYRNRYAQYKSDPDLMAAHASAPFVVTWDDHEVDNDYAGHQRRKRHAARSIPAASGRCVSGLLRDHAAAHVYTANGPAHAPLPSSRLRQPARS